MNNLKKERWSEELRRVLWACRTTPHTATQETPFSLAYGVEAVIPAEIEVPSGRRKVCPEDIELNKELLIDQLDMIEERREKAAIHKHNYQHAASRYYNSNVRDLAFSVGDLVLRKVFDGTKEQGAGKLGTRWEGPYKVTKEVRPDVYDLEKCKNGRPEMRPWNAYNLKRYYR
ncbi:hypothetical protein Bca4012_064063 [Brassica carinata]